MLDGTYKIEKYVKDKLNYSIARFIRFHKRQFWKLYTYQRPPGYGNHFSLLIMLKFNLNVDFILFVFVQGW